MRISSERLRRREPAVVATAFHKQQVDCIVPRPFFLLGFLLILILPLFAWAQNQDELTAEEIEKLNALGYTGEASTDSKKAGVTRIEEDAVCPGFRLFASGSAPVAYLIDVNGRTLHTWQMEPWHVDDDFQRAYPPDGGFFRKVRILDDGSLLVVFEAIGIAKLNKDSEVLWRVQNRAHHDLDISANGDIYVLHHYTRIIPRINKSELVVDDLIAVLDSEGREKDAISVLEALENSKEYGHLWKNYTTRKYLPQDILHPNSVTILDDVNEQRVPGFKKGNLLVSVAYLDAVVVIDPDKREVVWAHQGPYKVQHDPSILDNGNLLVFDNQGIWARSRVLEFQLPSMEVVWSFTGTEQVPFFSRTCGTCQRLPNGNTLIAETDGGRAIEVTSEGRIVWEFYNPYRTDEDKLASLFMMTWLPDDIKHFWE